jgi:hypothetical protein
MLVSPAVRRARVVHHCAAAASQSGLARSEPATADAPADPRRRWRPPPAEPLVTRSRRVRATEAEPTWEDAKWQ